MRLWRFPLRGRYQWPGKAGSTVPLVSGCGGFALCGELGDVVDD